MNQAHWHLLLNHFPIIGTYISVFVMICGYFFKNQSIKNMALGLLILSALICIPTLLTGEGAEEVLDSIGQKNEHFIHHHEEAAEFAFWICEATGLLALIALLTRRKKFAPILTVIVLIMGIINSFAMTKVGNTGGEVRHTEIRDTDSISSGEHEDHEERDE